MKKVSYLIMCVILSVFMVGCNEVSDLTDEETKVIAEYAADLLLKYDISFKDRISEGEDKLEKQAERMESQGVDATTEELTSEESMTEEDVTGDTDEGTDGTNDSETNHISREETDIAKMIGQSNLSITYKDYLITKQYPVTDEDDEFIDIEASEGYDLLVLQFQVVNTSSDAFNVSLMGDDIDYKLVCNGGKAAKPMLTILMNDLSTLETTIDPNGEQEAVLVFQISDSMKEQLDTIELHVQYNDVDNIITIQ